MRDNNIVATPMSERTRGFSGCYFKPTLRLERKQDNSGWNRYNLDGTAHVDERKTSQQHGPSQQTQQRLEELSKQVSDLKETVYILIAQIQALRSDVRDRNGNH